MTTRLPRDLHPVAWWLWALGLAAVASLTLNPLLLLTVIAVAAITVTLRRGDHPWSRAFRIYVWLAVLIVVLRVVLRVLLGGGYGGTVLFTLPEVPLPDIVLGIRLLGPVTAENVLGGLYDGLRLATLVLCVGAANALANPKRLLKSLPPALYEIGTVLVVAVTVVPQLADSARRVRAAQRLRPGPRGRVRSLRRFLVPILEDALERSLSLAAGMDVRGYGRAGDVPRRQRVRTGVLMVAGLLGVAVGTYGVLDLTAPRWLALPMLLGGLGVAVLGMVSAGRSVVRTRYRPDRWRGAEIVVVASGVGAAVVAYWVATHEPVIAYPALLSVPQVSVAALAAGLLGLVAAVAAPPPVLATSGPPAAFVVRDREEVAA
ncbi:energy-coupling factor transporter transmembrane component T [Nocardioides sp. CFH 31398]|uniref:energy-coupling factor transporter transmembrane component T n=1 Tax=Nocardioides sp. CFH 31398 TaxID=2919579 RepID=UPI001F052958|nr:energy-coupling factor transporter transmembrane component T [Nocardioides sp. CFH 31398]MCH1867295.1 energy-coupling factor transporter transmembrane protein EcfT [Nocardioides sp. CFH 31398]